MTVTYSQQAATSSFACFLKLLARWKGSIYKLIWKEFLIFVALYYTLSIIYRTTLNESQKRVFEKIARYCESNNNLIPLAFVLGFYVSLVIGRWWDHLMKIPWPSRLAFFVSAYVNGHDERGRLMRRTVMRYSMLSYVIVMNSISPVVKKRFPTFSHMTDAGFMTPNEQKVLENMNTSVNKYFVPLAWATAIISRARKENRVRNDIAEKVLMEELNNFRGSCGTMMFYDWISVPLVYTQVVTLATYMFFLSCLMGRQFVYSDDKDFVDIYIPVFTFLQFFFYMGWLKVAEALINPMGEDDDDFEINSTIDSNFKTCYLLVDEMHQEHPELIKDQYWDEENIELPYTAETMPSPDAKPFIGSTLNLSIPKDQQMYVMSTDAADLSDVVAEDAAGGGDKTPTVMPASMSRTISTASKTGRGGLVSFFRRGLSNQDHVKFLPSTSYKRVFSRNDSASPQNGRAGGDDFSVGSIMQKVPDSPPILLPSQEGIFEMSDLDLRSPLGSRDGERTPLLFREDSNNSDNNFTQQYLSKSIPKSITPIAEENEQEDDNVKTPEEREIENGDYTRRTNEEKEKKDDEKF